MEKAAALAAKPRAALLASRRLMRGDDEAVKARMAEEMHAFSAALKCPEAHAAFQAFFGGREDLAVDPAPELLVSSAMTSPASEHPAIASNCCGHRGHR